MPLKRNLTDEVEIVAPSLPPVKVPLEDLPSVEQPVTETIKFLSSLKQEIGCAFEAGETDEKSELESSTVAGLMLRAMCPISAEMVKVSFTT